MKVNKQGRMVYAQKVPNNYTTLPGGSYTDAEQGERNNATLPQGEGSFIRRHIYEMRFSIRSEESDDERRKREYLEWWEKKNE